MYKISIIIAIYNTEKYIRECVESVLSQTYPAYEILLINDGSTDNSGSICDQYANSYSNIHVIHKANGGVSSTRNTGILNAHGDYLYFIDGDDYILEDTLQSFVNILRLNSNVDLIHGRMSSFIDGEPLLTPDKIYIKEDWNALHISGQELFVNTIKDCGQIRTGIRGLYRKDFIIDNALFLDTLLYLAEDIAWTPKAFALAKCAMANSFPGYCHRTNRPNSFTSSISARRGATRFEVYRRWEMISLNPVCTSDFSKILQQQIGTRVTSTFYNFSRNIPANELKEFLMHVKRNKYLYKYNRLIGGFKLRIYFSLLGVNFTAYVLRLLEKIKSKQIF